MNECKKCPKDCYFDCNEHSCGKILAWEELTESDRMQTEYRAKGVVLDWSSSGNNHNPTGRGGK